METNHQKTEERRGDRTGVGRASHNTCLGCLGHHRKVSHLQSGTVGVFHGSVLGLAAR